MRITRLILMTLAALPLMAAIPEPIAVEGGQISGTPGWAWGVREYLGIPYAAPPVGNLRWRPPEPVVAWQGVRHLDRFSPACIQRPMVPDNGSWNHGLITTSEDCLYLNVWTPATAGTEKLPVMIWIHGGGGVSGSSAEPIYDGNAIAKRGVVVVSVNYRLGILGWMAHPELTSESEHHSSGNYGSLDQLAAIRWVKNNIARFGGDPGNVTIWGESGGCRSVNFLVGSPLLKGLAQKAIAESHTSFGRMTTLAEAEATGGAFAKAAGKNSIAEMRAMTPEQLLAVPASYAAGMMGAVVDGWFLPKDLYTIYSEGKQIDIPLLTGGTNDEGGNIGPAGGRGAAAPAPGAGAGAGGGRGATPNSLETYKAWVTRSFGARAESILKTYPATNDAEGKKAYHDVYRDINFAGHRTWAKLQSTTGKAPAYIYIFSHIPPHPATNGNNPAAAVGAVHFSEMIYVFDNLRMKDYPWTDLDRKVADTLASYWVNFARTGSPNGPGLAEWPVYSPKDEYWMNIGDKSGMERFNSAGVDAIAAAQEDVRKAQ